MQREADQVIEELKVYGFVLDTPLGRAHQDEVKTSTGVYQRDRNDITFYLSDHRRGNPMVEFAVTPDPFRNRSLGQRQVWDMDENLLDLEEEYLEEKGNPDGFAVELKVGEVPEGQLYDAFEDVEDALDRCTRWAARTDQTSF